MSMIRQSWLFAVLLGLLFVASPVLAATVLVDPNGADVPGVSYKSLRTALTSVKTWGDGNDTVNVASSAVHLVTANINVDIFDVSSTLTIKKLGANPAVIAVDSAPYEDPEAPHLSYLMQFLQSGTFILE